MYGRSRSSDAPRRAAAGSGAPVSVPALLVPALIVLLVTLLSACTAEVGIVATPFSADLISPSYFEQAEQAGIGKVILLSPAADAARGLWEPRVTGGTRLLLMPDVVAPELPAAGERYRLELGGSEDAASRDDGASGEAVIRHTRVGAFRSLGEALVAFFQNMGVEETGGSAETITVRLFSLRGEGERESEMEALLEPLRRELPPSALSVESYAPGFNIAPVQQRLREIPSGDPVLIFLGDPGGELLPLAASTSRLVVGESLFLPPGGRATEDFGEEGVYLLGLSPLTLFEAVVAGRSGKLEAELYRFDRGVVTTGFAR